MKATTKKRAVKKSAKKSARKVSRPVELKPSYTVTLTIAGQVSTGEGATLEEALTALPKPAKLMHKGDLSLVENHTGRRNTLHLVPVQLKRLFMSKAYLNVRVKSLMMGLR